MFQNLTLESLFLLKFQKLPFVDNPSFIETSLRWIDIIFYLIWYKLISNCQNFQHCRFKITDSSSKACRQYKKHPSKPTIFFITTQHVLFQKNFILFDEFLTEANRSQRDIQLRCKKEKIPQGIFFHVFSKTHFPIYTFTLPPNSLLELQTTKTRNQIVYDLNNEICKMNFDYINMKLCWTCKHSTHTCIC